MLKPFTLALLLSVSAFSTLAQTSPSTSSSQVGQQYQYCNLVGLGTQSREARLEYGQHAKTPINNPELDALDQEVKKLDSEIAGLNYMTSRGWEYVGVASLATHTIYVLRRRTQ